MWTVSEEKLPAAGVPPSNEQGVVLPFPMHRVPRLQSLSDDQVARLVWLLNQTEQIEKLLSDGKALMAGCPVARQILGGDR
jgi:hypothetical protein